MNAPKTESTNQDEITDEAIEISKDSEMIEISKQEYFYMRNEIIYLNGKKAALNELFVEIFGDRTANQSTTQSNQQLSQQEEVSEPKYLYQEERSAPVVIKDNFNVSIDGNEAPMTTENLEAFLQNRIKVKEIEEGKYAILFPMHRVEDGKLYEIYLIANDDSLYLSDEGATIEELDRVFELSEQDVIKNLVAILKQYGCKKVGKNIVIDCTPEDIFVKMSYLIQTISFMLNMKIFYV
jgi:hypothetical protein